MKKWRWALPVLVFVFIFGVYLGSLPVDYQFDGMVFAQVLRNTLVYHQPWQMAHFQHFLYLPGNYYLYQGLNKLFGYAPLEYFHLQLFSLLFGLGVLFLVYRFLLHAGKSAGWSLAVTTLLAFTYGIWNYSVEAEVHIPGLFFNLLAFYLIIIDKDDWRCLLGSAASLAFAAGFHLTNLLLFPGLLIFLLRQRRKWKTIVFYFLLIGLLVFLQLLTYSLFKASNPIKIIAGVLSGDDGYAGFKAASYWAPFAKQTFKVFFRSLAGDLLSPASPLLLYLSIFLMAMIILLAIGSLLHLRASSYTFPLILWALPFMLFFIFWDPAAGEFKLNIMLPLLLCFCFFLEASLKPKFSILILLAMAIVVGTLNYLFVMRPKTNLAVNTSYQSAMAIREHIPPGSYVIIAGCGSQESLYYKITIPYFAWRGNIILDWKLGQGKTLPQLSREFHQLRKQGIRLYLLSELMGVHPSLQELLQRHSIRREKFQSFLHSFQFKPPLPLPNQQKLLEIR